MGFSTSDSGSVLPEAGKGSDWPSSRWVSAIPLTLTFKHTRFASPMRGPRKEVVIPFPKLQADSGAVRGKRAGAMGDLAAAQSSAGQCMVIVSNLPIGCQASVLRSNLTSSRDVPSGRNSGKIGLLHSGTMARRSMDRATVAEPIAITSVNHKVVFKLNCGRDMGSKTVCSTGFTRYATASGSALPYRTVAS